MKVILKKLLFSIMILIIVNGCGESGDSSGGGSFVYPNTPVAESLYGTYTINSYSKTDANGNTQVHNGKGDLVITGNEIRYRFQYDNNGSSYYTYNYDDELDRVEYLKMFTSITIKNESENKILFKDFEATKTSDNRTVDSYYNALFLYDFKFTEPYVRNADGTVTWSLEGTYEIRNITNINGDEHYPKQMYDMMISFNDDEKNGLNNICEGVSLYKINTTKSYSYDKVILKFPNIPKPPYPVGENPCQISFDATNNVLSVNAGMYIKDMSNPSPPSPPPGVELYYDLIKMYDVVRF